ncbi:MAG: hypothetical protein AB4352_09205 [Hormoscilla sp.]
MKLMLKAFWSVVCVACLFVFCGVASAIAADNIVNFTTDGSFDDIRFEEIGHEISDDQDYEGTTYTYKDKKLEFNVRAGRHKTEKVADKFQDVVEGGGTIACFTNINLPNLLNFFVEGNLEIDKGGKTYTCPNFIIAQGNIDTTNNWWNASPNFINVSGAPMIGPAAQICLPSGIGLPAVLIVTPRPSNLGGIFCINDFNLALQPVKLPSKT